MPCYRCGTRQVDPDRGSSPWLRGVRADRQVLICPGCQADGAWVTDLDRCALCASVRLVRRLGEVECRDCGAVGVEATGSAAGAVAGSAAGPVAESVAGSVTVDLSVGEIALGDDSAADAVPPGLAEEVEQALARVLRGPAARAAGIS
ncbi:MAG TPA: hypothetical protein VEV63_06765 [Streptosporangiaceae bacterium]|nr:hypothetical protein [Streptosporangiaceae bacterium]